MQSSKHSYFQLLLLLGICLALACAGCSEAESANRRGGPTTAPVDVTVAPVKLDSAQRAVEVVGTLFGDEETTLSAKVSGRIVAVYHDVGDRVPPGQPLAQIETRDYELARSQKQLAMREALSRLGLTDFPASDLDTDSIPTVRKAKLAAENAEGRYQRGKQLHDQQPPRLSDQEFADLQTAWEVAKNEYQVQILAAQATLAEARARHAEMEMAEQQLADATIRAPAAQATVSTQPAQPDRLTDARERASIPVSTQPSDGREYAIAERLVSVGEFVNTGATLFRLIDDNPIKLRASVPERFVDEISTGQTVRVWVEAYPDPFEGTITRINPQIDSASRNFRIEALIDNTARQLKAGGFARASVQVRQEPNVMFVPQSAVVTFAGVNRVFVNDNGKAAERIVELGERRGDEIEIRRGLKSEDMIVISGATNLTPGTPLNVQAPSP